MKRTRHLLLTAALLVSTFSLTAGTITSVSELSNTKLYHVSQPNHSEGATAWAVQAGGSVLKSNNDLGIAPDNNDTCQQFAFLSNDGGVTRFLYHPAEEKFICRDGSLSTVPADPVYLKEGAYDNTFVAYFDNSHYINVGGSQQMVIDSWNTLDGGNSCAITAVGEFDPSAVIGSIPVTAQLDGIWYRLLLESRQASVVSNPDGVTKYTGDVSVSSAVTFDGLMCSVTSIGRYAFYGCDGLTSITLPESLESIGENAFEDCSGLTSINIPVSVTRIGRDAFYKCSSLVSVVIPVNVTCIEWGAFSCCNSLTSITIPESVTSIGDYAFSGCSGLASITIPESVTSIGYSAFNGCSGLTSITIPENVTSIGDYAFSGCSGFTSITIPESVTSIGDYAFSGCSGLTSITIPESVTSIGDDAFQNTAWYENQSEGVVYAGKVLYRYKGTMPENTSIEIKEGTKGIAGRAFYDCDGLASITIPESVTSIAGYAFYGCSLTEVQISSIEAWCNIDFGGIYANPLLFAENFCLDGEPIVELTIPNSVTAVKDYAFDGYDTLTSVTLPEGITSIGASAFSRCSSLTSITCEAETPPTIGSSLTFSEVDKSISVYVPSSSVEAYRAAEYWNGFTNIQPMVAFGTCGDNLTWRLTDAGELIIEGTGTMNDYGTVKDLPWYEHLSSITTVTIEEGVTSIGNYSFQYCSNLTSITIPEGVTKIGYCAFEHVHNLTSITIPESVTRIEQYAFGYCRSLTSITIPEGVTSIGSRAFRDCSGLASITIPESVTSIGYSAFSGCSGLTSITIPESVTSIGDYAFSGCVFLIDNFINNSTCSDSDNWGAILYEKDVNGILVYNDIVVGSLPSITEATIPEGVKSIRDGVFEHCGDLTSITIPASVTSIGDYVLRGCRSLTSIIVEEGNVIYDSREDCNAIIETNINALISGCSTTIIPNTVTSIEDYAFYGCISLTSITIPESVTSIGDYAFSACSGLTSITIPESVTSIGDYAFSGCSGLTSITIPESVTSVGVGAFDRCGRLTNVHISSIEAWCNIDFEGDFSNPIVHKENLYLNGNLVTELTIPNSVTAIKDYAFDSYPSLTSITLPESITSIGKAAFYYCRSLTSITIPEGMTSIGDKAFMKCNSLTSVVSLSAVAPEMGTDVFEDIASDATLTIPLGSTSSYEEAGWTSYFASVVEMAGGNDGNITWLLTPDGELIIRGTGAMNDYEDFTDVPWNEHRSSITKVTIKEGVTSIGSGAFFSCRNLTSVTLPEGVTSIGNQAFSICSSLTSIIIPESVTSIEVRAFESCSNLTSITIPASVVGIGNYAFNACSSLVSIVVAEGNAVYDSRENCNAIIETSSNTLVSGCSTTIIPSTVTGIGYSAFKDCRSLTSITIPASVTSIEGSAFAGCSSLVSIVVAEDNAVYDSREGCNAIIETNTNTLVLGCSTTIIPNTVTCIGDGAFYECSSLTSITIPEGVTSIGNHAFSRCGLTSIVIPAGVTSIGTGAFYGCSSLTSITLPAGVTSIEDATFSYCSSLSSITLPAGVTSIGTGAFEGCSSLTSITLPAGVTSIGNSAFSICSSLTSIIIPAGVTSIEDATFFECSSLISITLPAGVTSIGQYSFFSCSSLTSITIPEGVTSIGYCAFLDCSSLTSITIPESVTSIGEEAFYDCSSLTFITLPAGVTSIGNGAFCGCSSLTFITSEALTPPTIEAFYTFGHVDLSIPVYVPASSVSAYQSAECWSEFTNIQTIPEAITINQYGSATYCSEYALDFSEVEELKAYAATGYNTKTGVVTLTRVMTSQPGMGLFLKGEPGEYIVPTLESTDDNSLNMLVGTVERTAISSTSDDGRYRNYRYTIKSGDQEPLFYVVEEGYTLGKGKAYLQIPVAWLPAEAKAIGLRFDDGATTDIEDVESTENGEQATGIYDLMGRKVTNPQKGMMYIVNGKKTIMN